MRCIQVGSRGGTFLITRRYIPTHNSSLGRLGLIVHATAGFVDPGFKGTLTLEITNLTRVPIVLWPGKPIAQLSFMTLDRPAERPYGHPDLGSHYQSQVDATESRYEGGPPARCGRLAAHGARAARPGRRGGRALQDRASTCSAARSPSGPWCWASSACAARTFPGSERGARGVMAISAVLVVAAMAAAVLTS